MKKFEKNIDNRKVLVARISELTGLDAHYTFVPRCAYEIGAFTVEKDGRLTVEEGADENSEPRNGVRMTLRKRKRLPRLTRSRKCGSRRRTSSQSRHHRRHPMKRTLT